mmetsp:Transcript_22615/g.20082  ORF Transcript_22615/g.20082 Transcript_22615/m.20082 type:complete len:80 (+) Transcript_22615:154-393(+)
MKGKLKNNTLNNLKESKNGFSRLKQSVGSNNISFTSNSSIHMSNKGSKKTVNVSKPTNKNKIQRDSLSNSTKTQKDKIK